LLPSHVVSVLPPSTTGTNVAPRCIRFFLGEQDIVCSCYSWFRKFSKITYVFVASEIWQICSHLIDHRQASLQLERQAQAVVQAHDERPELKKTMDSASP
jgi:hypothetical protein